MEKFLQKSKLSRFIRNENSYTQSTFTCSKSTIETLEANGCFCMLSGLITKKERKATEKSGTTSQIP